MRDNLRTLLAGSAAGTPSRTAVGGPGTGTEYRWRRLW